MKTRTALFWRWLAENRGETADRVIGAPARTSVSRVTLTDGQAAIAGARPGAKALIA